MPSRRRALPQSPYSFHEPPRVQSGRIRAGLAAVAGFAGRYSDEIGAFGHAVLAVRCDVVTARPLTVTGPELLSLVKSGVRLAVPG